MTTSTAILDSEQKHKQWYLKVRGVVPVLREDERPPTLTALWRHWMRSCWIQQMWQNSIKADLYNKHLTSWQTVALVRQDVIQSDVAAGRRNSPVVLGVSVVDVSIFHALCCNNTRVMKMKRQKMRQKMRQKIKVRTVERMRVKNLVRKSIY